MKLREYSSDHSGRLDITGPLQKGGVLTNRQAMSAFGHTGHGADIAE
jgi:hypothetical protein